VAAARSVSTGKERADAENAAALSTVNMEKGKHVVKNVAALNIVNCMDDENQDAKNAAGVNIVNCTAEENHNVKNVKNWVLFLLVTRQVML
jgi:hypothetical protein